jgi:homoserine kinase type II
MSVFTAINDEALITFLAGYEVGELLDYAGIAEGIENTNYRVQTTRGRYVLTLLERNTPADLPYVLALLVHLHARGIPCPLPVADRKGAPTGQLEERLAVLATQLPGEHVEGPAESQCALVGTALARLHLTAADFPFQRANPRGPRWWRSSAEHLGEGLSYETQRILQEELVYLGRFDFARLPHGAIHADLFQDNVLFEQEHVSGLLDFYYACDDLYVFDLAVTINAWCSEADGRLDRYRMRALVAAYNAVRPLEQAEHAALPPMLRAAALRFWVSRLLDAQTPRAGELTAAKDPDEFLRILLARRAKLSGIQGP